MLINSNQRLKEYIYEVYGIALEPHYNRLEYLASVKHVGDIVSINTIEKSADYNNYMYRTYIIYNGVLHFCNVSIVENILC